MYIPHTYHAKNISDCLNVINRYRFATVMTWANNTPLVSHAPVLYEEDQSEYGSLILHLARANPQAAELANRVETLCIFHGPHSYISPSWYEAELAVPTWNYVVVHAYGTAEVIDDPQQLRAQLQQLVETYESQRANPWLGQLPDTYMSGMLRGIVGFRIPIQRMEGKFKLSQNRSKTDRQGVVDGLHESSAELDLAIAALMEAQL